MRVIALLPLIAAVAAAPYCQDNVELTVSATAVNILLPEDLNVTSVLASTGPALRRLVLSSPIENKTGTYTISGRYCLPEVQIASRAETIQLLVHGIGYTRDYWSGEGLPGSSKQVNGTMYSWVDYASQRGYPTFSIDRLCNGESTHLPSLLCQTQLNSAVLHEVAQQLRQGAVGNTKFSKVVCVGHSLGSIVVQSATQLYPGDFDAVVLTGYSLRLLAGFIGSVTAYAPVPAAITIPERYASLDPGYLVSGIKKTFTQLFYHESFLESLIDIDFARRGPFSIGELVTALLGLLPAPKYSGSVMVLTGQEDEVFCAVNPLGAVLGIPGNCGTGTSSASAEVQKLYPAAKSFSWYQVPAAGHCLNLHTNAKTTFEQAHNFIASV